MTLLSMEKMITKEVLTAYYEQMVVHQDHKHASKIVDLYEKISNHTYMVGFTGHFSAGKSSMINALLGEDILPKSPIPTSGNIVEIISGNGSARVSFNDDTSVIYEKPYDPEIIQAFCKDNQSVKKVTLHTAEDILPKRCMLIDTPGIDAANDADRLMTESSLHLVDYLFYVMDYNHVQSEINLHFLEKIEVQKIPYCIIINQIDKHDEQELPFDCFTERIKETFKQWNIYPNKIFFSSLIEPENQHNQFDCLSAYIDQLLTGEHNIEQTIQQSLQGIIADHKKVLQMKYEQNISAICVQENVSQSSSDEVADELQRLKQLPLNCKRIFQEDLHQTLKNAYLMPAPLREKAHSFLESRQRNFKTGLFASRKKIALEKDFRLESFFHAVEKSIEATIQWPFRDKVIRLLKKHQLAHPMLVESTKELTIHYTKEELISSTKQGAKVNGEYVLNYTNEISTLIKNKFKRQSENLWGKIETEINKQTSQPLYLLEEKVKDIERAEQQKQKKSNFKIDFENKLTKIDELIHLVPDQVNQTNIKKEIQRRNQSISSGKQPEKRRNHQATQTKEVKRYELHENWSIAQVTAAIDQTIDTIKRLPGFQTLIDDLEIKQERLTNRSLTIALFGAFSAGKSSFANALMGKNLLPSSPNPTTAVINRIKPVSEKNKHGTVVVQFKNEQTLFEDLLRITGDISPLKTDLNNFIQWFVENKSDQNHLLHKMHQTYLQAVIQGYRMMQKSLGQSKVITLKEFPDYITDETKACFIEQVTLYYDCSLTRLGITLVDTPGADSVNSRHTNVAFDYIKQADAILYVTYYNHALSRTDRDFLMQLGRVKDTFQLDKMYFIVNASDLARDQADLQLVINYVEDQLIRLGIRNPKIFAVSSKKSLADKLAGHPLNDDMRVFETAFYQFINQDLVTLSIQSILWDIKRANQNIKHYQKTLDLNEQEKQQYRHHLTQNKMLLNNIVVDADMHVFHERIIQRIDRQTYHVIERLKIRFHDLFKERFNPATISGSGRKSAQQLQVNLQYLIDDITYELLQELRAVALRMESFLTRLAKEVYNDLHNQMNNIDENFSLPFVEINMLHTPKFQETLSNIHIKSLDKVLQKFKGTRDFFAGNKKDVIKDGVFEQLMPNIEQHVQLNKQIMVQEYLIQWGILFKNNKETVKRNIEIYIDNQLQMISSTIDIHKIEKKQQKLAKIIDAGFIKDDL